MSVTRAFKVTEADHVQVLFSIMLEEFMKDQELRTSGKTSKVLWLKSFYITSVKADIF